MKNAFNPTQTHPVGMPMDRRGFIQKAALGAMALSFPKKFFKVMPMGIVVHSYASRWNSKSESKKYPGFVNAIDLLEHCHKIGAGGVQVGVKDWTTDFAKKVRACSGRARQPTGRRDGVVL